MAKKIISSHSTMEELLASLSHASLLLERGQEVEGEIVYITEKEVTLDLGTKSEGIISTRDIPEGKLKELKVGSKIKAFVEDVENESGQVVLSLQKAEPQRQPGSMPQKVDDSIWEEAAKKYIQGEVIKGIVSKTTPHGIFVKLEEGIEGLIHSSKISAGQKYDEGSQISVIVDSIDPEKRRISLAPVITSTKGLIYK